jgi:hypothetical protein
MFDYEEQEWEEGPWKKKNYSLPTLLANRAVLVTEMCSDFICNFQKLSLKKEEEEEENTWNWPINNLHSEDVLQMLAVS